MASPEENLASALAKAAQARAAGKEDRAAGWDAAAERYRTIIASKAKIATAKSNIEAIQKKLSTTPTQIISNPPRISNEGGGGGSGNVPQSSNVPSTVTPTPATPSSVASVSPVTSTPAPNPVKTAPIDTILFDDSLVSIDFMADLIFENIGGHELINIARNDIVNGQTVSYQPIKNLTSIQKQYNPNNIISLQETSGKYFDNYAIKFEDKIPSVANGPFGNNVYLNNLTGDVVIDLINLEPDEQVEVQIIISGTIYSTDFQEGVS
jgi:hypothetical protein